MDEKKNERLFSLDLLRGLDMFLLTVIGPLWCAVSALWGPFPNWVSRNFGHYWGAFGLWDLIMPMFIFMCGAAIPFALGRRLKDGRPTPAFWKHLLYRFVLLWVLGMVAQGHLLSLDWKEISPFNNTLQTIAAGYVIAALVLLIPNRKVRWAIPVVLALAYAVPLAICGDYSPGGCVMLEGVLPVVPNGATCLADGSLLLPPGCTFENGRLLGLSLPDWCAAYGSAVFPGGTVVAQGDNLVIAGGNAAWLLEAKILNLLLPAGSNVLVHRDPGYTWFATIPMFGVMTLCGMIATEILTAAKEKARKGFELLALGAVLLAFGWAIYPVIPSIKHIYSLTFTAQAMGWCCLALAALYFLSDVWGVRRGLGLFILFGQHALTAYLVTETLFVGAAMKLVQCFVGGLPNLLGTKQYQILFENLGFAVLLVLVLVAKHRLAEWRRARTFI